MTFNNVSFGVVQRTRTNGPDGPTRGGTRDTATVASVVQDLEDVLA